MNEQERSELERLKRRLESLRYEFDLLWAQTQQLQARLNQGEPAPAALQPESIKPVEITPLETPPADTAIPLAETPVEAPKPPPLPPIITPQPAFAAEQRTDALAAARPVSPPVIEDAFATAQTEYSSTAADATPPQSSSFEMRLGTYWLGRIGIVMVLTAMVFLGYLAYDRYVPLLGPAGKVVLLYLGNAILLGTGAWLQRAQVKEGMRNFGQVVFAGGLAGVYFTTYAAHHIPALLVIPNALLDGVLLLAWAGFIVWLADRKKSELLSLFAIGLAYYTSVITHVGLFTLYSNLVLTAAAVFFLVRNRWATLSYLSLVATYAGYAFWRFYHGGDWRWATPEEGLWTGNYFLMAYWMVFTAAVFLSRHENFAGENRASFLTINNVAFFALFVLTLLQVRHGGFWKFSMIYGGVLLAMAALARQFLSNEAIVRNSYLTQGLLLVTVGLIAKFSGLQLALLLAAESVVLLTLGYQRNSLILHVGGYLTAALATGWAVVEMNRFDTPGAWLGAGVGALLVFNAFWTRRQDSDAEEGFARPNTTYFAALGLSVWLVTTWNNVERTNVALVLSAEALLLTASFYLLRVREITLLGQGYLVLAHVVWLYDAVYNSARFPWWNSASLIAITLGLSHWWQRQTALKLEEEAHRFFQAIYALAVTGLLYFWLQPLFAPQSWLALTSLLAIALTAYGAATRAWFVALTGQLFLPVSIWQFARQLWEGKPEWHFAIAPIATLAFLSLAAVQCFKQRSEADEDVRAPILQLGLAYRWVALVMSLGWIYEYIPASERFWVLVSMGALIFWWSGWQKKQEGILFSAVFTAAGFCVFWFPLDGAPVVTWANLLTILLLLGQQRLARRMSEHFAFSPAWHTVMILLGGLSLWRYVSRWVLLESSGFYLTVSWAVLALLMFVAGLALRERMYRWLGLSVLACALGRVVILDVWKLETLYRILSFGALGIVLLVLGFIYNKYQEKIKEWL